MRCNCENAHCQHRAGNCGTEAGTGRIIYLGEVCDPCLERMPEECRLPRVEQESEEYPLLAAYFKLLASKRKQG